jgi:hypothetical protein
MRAYAKQAKNRQLEIDAAEIRIRAERRVGELIQQQRESVGLNRGTAGAGRPTKGGSRKEPPNVQPPRLIDAGIDKKLSARAQQLAAVPEPKFNAMIADWRGRVAQETERVTTNLIRAGEREQKTCRPRAAAIPYGSERYWSANGEQPPQGRCHDCGVLPGGIHHKHCDMEECRQCGGQALGCECTDPSMVQRS